MAATLAQLKQELVLLQDYWHKRNVDFTLLEGEAEEEDLCERVGAFLVMNDLKADITEIEEKLGIGV